MKQINRRRQKKRALNPIYDMVRVVKSQVRLNELWSKDDEWKVKGKWSSRAYFLQDLKKFVPDDIEIIMSQRAGTFAKVKR